METAEQHLINVKREKNEELESYFNALIMNGEDFTYGASGVIHIAGGRNALAGLSSLHSFYVNHNVNPVYVRNPLDGTTHEMTTDDMGSLIQDVFDWGHNNYYINIRKQDYVLNCSTVEDVLDVTWNSPEVSGIL